MSYDAIYGWEDDYATHKESTLVTSCSNTSGTTTNSLPPLCILKSHVYQGLWRRLAHADLCRAGEDARLLLLEPNVYEQPVAVHSGEFSNRLAGPA
ncbi:hypothetical protein H0A65_00610 [Alcaligenaceae bacterium]|nr:hypothetical protein [Alcaligenaceae bacterium]